MHTTHIEFEFDCNKAYLNQRKHGVSFGHAELALRDEMVVTIADPDDIGEQRVITWALTHWVGCSSWSTPSAENGLV